MDVKLSIGDQEEIWERRRQKLEALKGADPSQRQDDPAQPNKFIDPLLFSAAKEPDVDKFIKALEDHCAKERVFLHVLLERRSPSESTLYHAAAETDDNVRAVIHFFPEHLTYCANSRVETPLHIAARAGKAVAVELLIRQGVLIDPDRCGNSALHEAVRNRHRKVIGQLVREDPSLLYCENNESKSPLCIAIETGDLEVLTLLLEAPNNGEDWRRSKGERIFRMPPVHVAILHTEKDMLIKMWGKSRGYFN
ncbi:nuclear factor NF-kappa-B p105 subunit-like [Eucalyptus grandis]|uniref:nuclear factor NF-kappa-B p105 subunit-like n=1 Tax=Eucalyptus grandis TaxID=71139 RepID=UPI00192EB762|nr:nuclear factor NF-kappa-B p105 subunit-like [Eucalyptus grandis]